MPSKTTSSDLPNDRFPASFTSTNGAKPENVRVELTERGIAIDRRDSTSPLIWPYGALTTRDPLSPRAIDALVTYKYQPGATLFVQGAPFARALAKRAPQLTTRAARWRSARPWLYAATALALVIGAIQLTNISPAQTVAGLLPDGVRDTIGSQVVSQMTKGRPVCKAQAGNEALKQLAARLSPNEEFKRFEITVVDWDLLNAFAAPGDKIVLTRELIEKARGPDELAGVLAHEMGHSLALHPEASIVRTIGLAASVELLLGGGGLLTGLGISLTQLAYSRGAEREADEAAIRLLRTAQISPDGLTNFFRRIAKLENERNGSQATKKDNAPNFDLWRSHPQTTERLRRVEQLEPYQATPALDAAAWRDLKAICKK